MDDTARKTSQHVSRRDGRIREDGLLSRRIMSVSRQGSRQTPSVRAESGKNRQDPDESRDRSQRVDHRRADSEHILITTSSSSSSRSQTWSGSRSLHRRVTVPRITSSERWRHISTRSRSSEDDMSRSEKESSPRKDLVSYESF